MRCRVKMKGWMRLCECTLVVLLVTCFVAGSIIFWPAMWQPSLEMSWGGGGNTMQYGNCSAQRPVVLLTSSPERVKTGMMKAYFYDYILPTNPSKVILSLPWRYRSTTTYDVTD